MSKSLLPAISGIFCSTRGKSNIEAGNYTSCFSHSVSFSSALPRCEILFFSALGISAYVWPSYSKHASQPANNQPHAHVQT